MITINERNTIQKALILEAVKSMSNHPTADEIYDEVVKKWPNISKGTVYRNLNALEIKGDILRVVVANAPDRFDKTTERHVHMHCLRCGRVYDVIFNQKIEINQELNPEFEITDYELLLKGYCKKCKETNILE